MSTGKIARQAGVDHAESNLFEVQSLGQSTLIATGGLADDLDGAGVLGDKFESSLWMPAAQLGSETDWERKQTSREFLETSTPR